MREKLLALGGTIGLTLTSIPTCTAPKSEFIEGTVVGIRQEKEETRIEHRVMSLSDCPDGTTHLSNRCLPKPHDVTVQIRDVFDHVLVLKGPTGDTFDVYVWPRVEGNAVVGGPIAIDPRYGSLTDRNNEETILSKSPIKGR